MGIEDVSSRGEEEDPAGARLGDCRSCDLGDREEEAAVAAASTLGVRAPLGSRPEADGDVEGSHEGGGV